MRISDWSSDLCSSDLCEALDAHARLREVDLAAARAARREHGDIGVALAEPDRRGEAEVRSGPPLLRVEPAGAQVRDRKSRVSGQSVSVSVEPGGRSIIQKETEQTS